MRPILLLLGLLVLSSSARAQAAQPTPKGELSHRPRTGSLPAEVAAAVLGDVVGLGLTAALVIPVIPFCLCDGEGDDPTLFYSLWGTSLLLRPVMVGGITAGIGRRTGGAGRAYVAMLGALPGTAIILGGWAAVFAGGDGAGILLVGSGHVATMAGAVWAYRHAAERNPRPRAASSLARFVPTPYVDPARGAGGLALAGTF